ncbi:hypothetical protein COU79_00845 [Candidatus Peregrinibacteria bacterium CG10_big_fil_rev_8_21_14_0_10_54_7]|nr:MAG: hypothetical protein COU79_00845 [Candidatus Peregrinibacteria bacterium CG10_big_fil_rev_8_21_14_0_10_54_7]
MKRNNLKLIIENEGITEPELSTSSGVSVTTINRAANHRHDCTPKTKSKIVAGLNKITERHYERCEVFPELT